MGVSSSRKPRACSLCGFEVSPKERRHAMAGKHVYYDSYSEDIGDPSMSRKFFYCSDCTTSHAQWMLERMNL